MSVTDECQMSQSPRLTPLYHRSCVRASKLLPSNTSPTHLLVARGAALTLHHYPALTEIGTVRWPARGQIIHGLALIADTNQLIIYGGRHVHVYQCTPTHADSGSGSGNGNGSGLSLKYQYRVSGVSDHVWKIHILNKCRCHVLAGTGGDSDSGGVDVAIGYAHNRVSICSLSQSSARFVHRSECSERALLYSQTFYGQCRHTLTAISGTVFGAIIVWNASVSAHTDNGNHSENVSARLPGHDGAIFHLSCTDDGSMVASASDDRSVRLWRRTATASGYDCVATMYGHSARVFTVSFIHPSLSPSWLVSVGEDDTLCVWRDGSLVKQWSERGAKGSLWNIEIDQYRCKAIVGCGDSRVRVIDLSNTNTDSVNDTRHYINVSDLQPTNTGNNADDYCRCMAHDHQRDSFLIGLASGRVFRINSQSWHSELLFQCHLNGNALLVTLSVSMCGSVIACGDSRGNLHLFDGNRSPVPIVHRDYHRTGVSFVQWLQCNHRRDGGSASESLQLMTGDAIGEVQLSRYHRHCRDQPLQPWLTFRVPVKTHINVVLDTTVALTDADTDSDNADSMRILMVGDSKGSIYLYHLTHSHIYACSRVLNGHGVTGVTTLQRYRSIVITTGRDGCVNHYRLAVGDRVVVDDSRWQTRHHQSLAIDESVLPSKVAVLEPVQTTHTKLTFIHSLQRRSSPAQALARSHATIVSGFAGTEYLVYDLADNAILLRVECGGGQRPALFLTHTDIDSGTERAMFVYSDRQSIIGLSLALNAANRSMIGAPYHTRLTTCLSFLTVCDLTLIATGSEDRSVRLHHWHPQTLTLTLAAMMTDHPDTIRCLSLSCSTTITSAMLLFTAGGANYCHCYRVEGDLTVASVGYLGGSGIEVQDKHWLKDAGAIDSENLTQMDLRLMSITTFPLPSPSSLLVCVIGDSSGSLRLYLFDESNGAFHLLYQSLVHAHPVLSLAHTDNGIVVSGDTAGRVCVWDVRQVMIVAGNQLRSDGIVRPLASVEPILNLHVHQAGVNAAIVKTVAGSGRDGPRYVAVTGGDDQSLQTLTFTVHPTVRHTHTVRSLAHSSAIKCLAWLGDDPNQLVTSGYDQRVFVWRLNTESVDADCVPSVSAERVGRTLLELSDVACLSALTTDGDTTLVAVGGQGLQLLRVDKQ